MQLCTFSTNPQELKLCWGITCASSVPSSKAVLRYPPMTFNMIQIVRYGALALSRGKFDSNKGNNRDFKGRIMIFKGRIMILKG